MSGPTGLGAGGAAESRVVDPSGPAVGERLTPVQVVVRQAVLSGQPCDLAGGAAVSFGEMPGWGSNREVDPGWLAELLSGRGGLDPHPAGLTLRGARFSGPVDWRGYHVVARVALQDCYLDSGVLLDRARGVQLELIGCRIEGGVCARGLQLAHDLTLDRSRITGQLALAHAHIGGSLSADGAEIGSALPRNSAAAVDGEYLHVGADLRLEDGFTATGEVGLLDATLGGLDCSGGTFSNEGGNALIMDRAQVSGGVFLNDGFSATGTVRLSGATLTGLYCRDGTFSNEDGNALVFDQAQISGNVFLDGGFSATGTVRLLGASLGGLDCSGGTFRNEGGNALYFDGAQVRGSVFLNGGFSATGTVRLPDATLAGLDCSGGTFSNAEGAAFEGEGMTVVGSLVWRQHGQPPLGRVNLSRAAVGELQDDETGWPEQGKLLLGGFSYSRLADTAPRTPKKRLRWLGLQPGYSPQPYEQLIRVYRAGGHDQEAREIAIAKQRARRRSGGMTRPSKAWSCFWTSPPDTATSRGGSPRYSRCCTSPPS